MSRWLPRVLNAIRGLAAANKVRFTLKAAREIAELDLGLDERDVCTVLVRLKDSDSVGRLRAEHTGEWLYVFTPTVAGEKIYVKLLVRTQCILISFHEQVGDEEEDL
jgi:hypothetical protein